ncbi:Asp/Glu racemase [Rhodococcus sp. NPDC057529]|uniref:maleate cis-trans isomerase family protein n=1 Tax=Rhodococcus sp. NPDC057529 TaxID=3346158 RepID=UPI00366E3F0A
MPPMTRIGMITPSSNTCLEPLTYEILGDLKDVSAHFTRLSVTQISLGDQAKAAFDTDRLVTAAELLAQAGVDVIAWNGTSGSWLGPAQDSELCAHITNTTGIRATTSTLAMFDAYKKLGVTRLSLVTPYTEDVVADIVDHYAQLGFEVVREAHAGLTDNVEIGNLNPDKVGDLAVQASSDAAQAVSVVCTNISTGRLTEALEDRVAMPLVDSVIATLWKCLDLSDTSRRPVPGWGRLMNT